MTRWVAWLEGQLRKPHPAVILLAKLIGLSAIIVTCVALWNDLRVHDEEKRKRTEDRINQAWQVIASVKDGGSIEGAVGRSCDETVDDRRHKKRHHQENVGLIEALKTLASEGIDLTYTELPNAYLFRAELERAKLSGANLQGAELTMANLQYAYLGSAKLSQATLTGANLQRAHLEGACLKEADLTGAFFCEADLSEAILTRADLTGGVSLRGANLFKAELTHADLIEADLVGANLENANLENADLENADLKCANLKKANLENANLENADLSGANLTEASVATEQINVAVLCHTILQNGDKSNCPDRTDENRCANLAKSEDALEVRELRKSGESVGRGCTPRPNRQTGLMD